MNKLKLIEGWFIFCMIVFLLCVSSGTLISYIAIGIWCINLLFLLTNKESIKFQKVSYERFKEDWLDALPTDKITWSDAELNALYNSIKLPTRATKGSAGYDFFTPFTFTLAPNETIKIPTGIRCEMPQNTVLQLYPRSGLGFKYRLQLNNTVGIIDSDYFYSDNEGHIFIKVTNDSNENKTITVKEGEGFAQGIFTKYLLTIDDCAKQKRNGGFGSTTTKK